MERSTSASGNAGCECINQADALSSPSPFTNNATSQTLSCKTSTGENGVLAIGGVCVPYSYGVNCKPHDMYHDPKCQQWTNTSISPAEFTSAMTPSRYCFQEFCYIDRDRCKRESSEILYASDLFPSLKNLYYSYSTCNSSAEDWLEFLHGDGTSEHHVLGGISLYAAVPNSHQYPYLYKRNADGDISVDAHFNDSIPYRGIYMEFFQHLIDISGGNIANITYTHPSVASIKRHSSNYTATVQDIENGIVDMSVAPFWVTGERIKMAAFTVPLVYDRVMLVIEMPGVEKSLGYEASKVMEPFTAWLWLVAAAIIVIAALLSVWFSKQHLTKKRYGKNVRQLGPHLHKNKRAYARLFFDEVLEKGTFFFSAGIEQDKGASLPQKLLMCGFGFFILIAVSAYVANLAAFLTRSGAEAFIGTMEEVVSKEKFICAHQVLKDELISKWPKAKFVWQSKDKDMIDLYDEGKCKFLAIGREDNILNEEYMERLCNRSLVFTDSLIFEIPIAFPVKPELASGISYWILQGEKYKGVSIPNSIESYMSENGGPSCPIDLNQQWEESDDFAQVKPLNMILPILVFLIFAVAAIIVQIIHERSEKEGKQGLIGRTSALNLMTDEPDKGLVDGARELAASATTVIRRRLTPDHNYNNKSQRESPNSLNGDQDTFPNSDAKRSVTFNDDLGGDCFDTFQDNGTLPRSIFRGSIDDYDVEREQTTSAIEENELDMRIQKIVDSGAIDDVLECLQEMKRLKKLK